MTAPGSPTHPDETAERRRPRLAAGALWFLVLEGLLALTTVPTLVWLLFLDPVWQDVALIVALGLPVGPAVSATLFAWRRFTQGEDTGPARHFWRGYRLNWADALRIWAPSLTLLTLLAVVLLSLPGDDAPAAAGAVAGLVTVLLAVSAAHAMLVVSLFSFRTRDVVRVAVYFVISSPSASLRVLAIIAVGAAAAWFVHPALPVALGSVLTYLLWRNGVPIAAEVERRFVTGAAGTPEGGAGVEHADRAGDDDR